MSGTNNGNGGVFWKLVLTAMVVAWAISSMVPFSDTPFEDYIKTRATAFQQEFAGVIKSAEARVDKVNYKGNPDKSPTLYIALRDYANANEVDLSKYFPDINVSDIKILKKRNDILLKELYRQSKGALKKGLDLQGGVSFTLEIDESNLKSNEQLRSGQLEDVLTVMNNRINGLGVTEPTIRIMGGNAIEVQMPGVSLKDNPEAIEELSRPAKLEFRLVHRTLRPSSAKPPLSEIPVGYEVLLMESERGGKVIEEPFYVKRRPEANGNIIKDAYPAMEDANRFSVSMEFTPEGSKVFEKITSSILEEDRKTGVKQPLAIVLDGRLVSAPNIQSVISSRGSITGNFTRREAIELANALNNPLSVGLKRTSLNEVGPSLAEDAKDSSLMAVAIGAIATIAFMIFVYWSMGIIAVFSVLVNILILVGVLASFGATMTLPGIAALVLTLGMAVDSNILVFERMREETHLGKSLWTALEMGHEKAFSTIVDANITTLISAIILWKFGSGPVKGFGVTLAVGILTTLFCCLILSRALLELTIRHNLIRKALTKTLLAADLNINFMKYAKASFAISWTIVILGVATMIYRGDKTLSIDFTGGDLVTIGFNEDKKPPIGEILALSESTSDTGIGEIQASYQTDLASKVERLVLQVESEKGDRVFEKIKEKFPDAGLYLVGQQSVGASVSKDITRDAFIALAISLLSILLYIAVRFEFSYGIGALVATFHDVILTIGLYIILGLFGVGSGQFSAPMVAAILMVMGYSINDKIVVFDRIREELVLKPTMSLRDIINYSINRTLSRTMLTSLSTFIVALALFVFGTGIIVDFSLVFMLGIVVGTYSSIFIANPVFYWWNKGNRAKVEKESAPANLKKEWEE
ncbi:protein-export membrane protein SecD [Coraliomargarita sp. CAG:312]|nr:protein-export membrane protein SecD [Coraliomargarita sp. CAG:312]